MANTSDTTKDLSAARVLIVEDDVHYAEWLSLALLDLGIKNTSKASDGKVALDTIESEAPFDLIICDWVMPNMDGLEFLKSFREFDDSSMVLFLTVRSDLEGVFEATQSGASHYLVKPVSVEALQE